MPARLRPTAPIAADPILGGARGRALMLAQELLEQPKMSNHARGLWGYSGVTAGGRELTIQATGMGGPSAAVVLGDLAELGVRRGIRIGTCASLGDLGLGQPLIVTEAHRQGGEIALPDPGLTSGLEERLEGAVRGGVVSLDSLHRPETNIPAAGVAGADMQTATLLQAAKDHRVAAAAALIATEKGASGRLRDEELDGAAKRAGQAASTALST